MQQLKNTFRICTAIVLLFIFLSKFTTAVFGMHTSARNTTCITGDTADNKDCTDDNDDETTLLKITDEYDSPYTGYLIHPEYAVTGSFHRQYLLHFIPAYYPSIIAPPPNSWTYKAHYC